MPRQEENLEELNSYLRTMVQRNASDLFITAGLAPTLKIHGKLFPADSTELGADQVKQLAFLLMDDGQEEEFRRTQETNFAIESDNIGRFRVNVFQQKNQVGMVLRKIETRIPEVKHLGLPEIIIDLAMDKRGLVLIVGATGSGKSTTVASMIGHRNTYGTGHIITIEDPIEFVHNHGSCVVTQREVGVDTQSFESALKNTLRQAPDVVLIGEIRTREVMQHAITFAETGHLCLATMHANNANQALDRIANFFPDDRRNQLLLDLSLNLKAIIAQQLIPTPSHSGRSVALEILLNTPLTAKHILNGEFYKLKEVIQKSTPLGMQTFDQALFDLYKKGDISYDDAIHHADAPNGLRLMVKLDKDNKLDTNTSAVENMSLLDPRDT